MFQNMLMTSFTPLHTMNEQYHWENRPFVGIWPEQKKVNASSGSTKTKRRRRTAFTTNQLTLLEKEFTKDRYVKKEKREELSKLMNITERTIKIWFQNRRMKYKIEEGLVTPPKSEYDTVKVQVERESIENVPTNLQQSDYFQSKRHTRHVDEPLPQIDSNNIPQTSNTLERFSPYPYDYSSYYNPNTEEHYNNLSIQPNNNYYTTYNNNSQWTHNHKTDDDVNYLNL